MPLARQSEAPIRFLASNALRFAKFPATQQNQLSTEGNIMHTPTDFELFETISYAEAALAAHAEMDCDGGGEYDCPECTANREAITEARAEQDRRIASGMRVDDPRVGLQALEPWGYEWQQEQIERAGH